MKYFLSTTFITAAIISMSTFAAEPVAAVNGKCPIFYNKHKGYCTPRRSARDAIQKVGSSCPLYWSERGGFCVKRSERHGTHTIERVGSSCPSGYNKQKGYCVKR